MQLINQEERQLGDTQCTPGWEILGIVLRTITKNYYLRMQVFGIQEAVAPFIQLIPPCESFLNDPC